MYKKGFTLIELLVVIAIIGILAAIIMANLGTGKSKGRDAKRVSDIKTLQLALELYYNDNGYFPLTISTLVPTYVPIEPKDPSDNLTAYKYTAINPAGSVNCTTATVRTKYHLGADMENDQLSNTSLGQDHDYYTGTYSHAACSGSGSDFHGNANDCSGTTSANPDRCYDVTN